MKLLFKVCGRYVVVQGENLSFIFFQHLWHGFTLDGVPDNFFLALIVLSFLLYHCHYLAYVCTLQILPSKINMTFVGAVTSPGLVRCLVNTRARCLVK